MATFIALLRGINVSGHNKVAMADLRGMAEGMGFSNARTLLQSGNLVFEAAAMKGSALEAKLEAESQKELGVTVDYIVRTSAEWRKIIDANPFPREAKADPSHLLVMCMKTPPDQSRFKTIQSKIIGGEDIRWIGTQLYISFPNGIGRSKLNNTMIERELRVRGTARNWNTVIKLAEISS